MKNFNPGNPRGPLAVIAFALSAVTLSIFIVLPLVVGSRVPELRECAVPVASR